MLKTRWKWRKELEQIGDWSA